jgi:hypothetical protein
MRQLFLVAAACAAMSTTSVQAAEVPADKSAPPAARSNEKPAAATGEQTPPMPKPGPEHEVLKKSVGTWDATVEMCDPTGAPVSTSKGVETNALSLGGLWLVSDFRGEMMGQPFQGHGVSGYDPVKKKYVGTWVDSMSVGLATMEGTWDPKTNTMTEWMEGPDPSGKVSKMKAVSEWKDDSTRVFSMYEEGKDKPSMRITYKKK